jgi:hypothetical protein
VHMHHGKMRRVLADRLEFVSPFYRYTMSLNPSAT